MEKLNDRKRFFQKKQLFNTKPLQLLIRIGTEITAFSSDCASGAEKVEYKLHG